MTWAVAPTICAVCSHRWVAVVEVGPFSEATGEQEVLLVSLECPSCGSMAGILEEEA